MSQEKRKVLRVSIDGFAYEIGTDLKKLIEEYPNGIFYSHIADEYGESIARIAKACQILQDKGIIDVYQAASNAYYILPKGYKPSHPLIELTDLQRRLALYLLIVCRRAQTNRIKANYARLAKLMECSYGGLVTAVKRLNALAYVEIVSDKPLILQVTEKLLQQDIPYT